MEFEKVIKERYSCRKFLNKEVEEDKLMAVLQAGRIAPTAKNRQPFKIYVLNRDTYADHKILHNIHLYNKSYKEKSLNPSKPSVVYNRLKSHRKRRVENQGKR